MLVVEMQRNFLLKAKTLDRTDIKDLQSYDILFYLNQAQDILIDRLFAERNFEALRPLVDDASIAAASFIATGTYDPGVTGAKVVDLSAQSSFRNFIRSQSKLTRSAVPAATDVLVANKEIDKMEVFRYETNGTNKPIFTNPRTWTEGKYLIVLPDAYSTLSYVYVTYLKIPTALILTTPASDTSDLPAHLHQQIVDIAVDMAQLTINVNDAKR